MQIQIPIIICSYFGIWGDNLNKINLHSISKLEFFTSDVLLSLYISDDILFRIVGGTVRDLLMDVMPTDIDLSIDAKPHETEVFSCYLSMHAKFFSY